ncbi:REP-associated tyrosine transposase [Legionella cardiaca]|uniref:Transposase IS200-like domain-containing protein n=1 Tax=Legionella cardiaca TaxID=1071983 RepID=A0ABY8AXX6_9GAMM|nr:transposase [Legionella cardiaca]WED44604.1 hypothetical protein PXX05_07390 [Legionella cardiaca]
MVNYRRDYSHGAIYFFTLTLKSRKSTYLTTYIDVLGQSFRAVKAKFNFKTHAIIVLPDHLHLIGELPKEDCNYSQRWRLIKTRFTQGLIKKGGWLTEIIVVKEMFGKIAFGSIVLEMTMIWRNTLIIFIIIL